LSLLLITPHLSLIIGTSATDNKELGKIHVQSHDINKNRLQQGAYHNLAMGLQFDGEKLKTDTSGRPEKSLFVVILYAGRLLSFSGVLIWISHPFFY